MTGRRFTLIRDRDLTGVSGVGPVATGIMWPDGAVTMRWRGHYCSTVHWDATQSIGAVTAIHGHDGATRIVWIDGPADG